MLSRYHQKVGCKTHHSQADADLLIVQTAVESVGRASTVLVGDDTDLLISLCYYTEISAEELFFQPEPRANSTKRRLENESSEGEAGPRRVQQHFLRPCNPWM